jgi:serine/threonine-protein kinase
MATNELDSERLHQLEQHLDQCPQCLELMRQAVTAPWLDNPAVELLKGADSSSTAIDENNAHTASYASILRMLGPTDDPHRLGRIDTYEVVGIIGRGGAGVVFKAFDPALQRFVAIKMLLPHLAESAAARKRFAREAKAAAAVVDDYVLPIHGISEWRGVPYIVSQYCRGETLQKRIEVRGTLETKEILRIAGQIAKGLAAAHAQGLVHRDVKPANILLDTGIERVQLTDFGLARAIDDASMTRTGVLAGTPQFMSPEQAQGEPLDGRSDLFALGSVIYAMCTGSPPFRATQPLAILQKISNEHHAPVQSVNPDIPRRLSKMIDRLLEKRPADRIQSADEVAKWLEAYLAYVQHPTGVVKPKLPISNKNRKRLKVLGLAFLTTVFGWAGLGVYHHRSSLSHLSLIQPVERDVHTSSSAGGGIGERGMSPAIAKEWAARVQELVDEEQALMGQHSEMVKLYERMERYDQRQAEFEIPRFESDALTSGIDALRRQINEFESSQTKW